MAEMAEYSINLYDIDPADITAIQNAVQQLKDTDVADLKNKLYMNGYTVNSYGWYRLNNSDYGEVLNIQGDGLLLGWLMVADGSQEPVRCSVIIDGTETTYTTDPMMNVTDCFSAGYITEPANAWSNSVIEGDTKLIKTEGFKEPYGIEYGKPIEFNTSLVFKFNALADSGRLYVLVAV